MGCDMFVYLMEDRQAIVTSSRRDWNSSFAGGTFSFSGADVDTAVSTDDENAVAELNDWRETSALALPICEAKEGRDCDSNEFFRRARVFFLMDAKSGTKSSSTSFSSTFFFGATASTDLKKLLPNKPRISSKLSLSSSPL